MLSTPPAFVLSQDQTLQKNQKTNHTPTQTTKKATKISTQPIPIAQKTNPDPNQFKQPTPPPSASHNTPQPTQPEDTTTNQKKQGKPKTKNKTKWHKKQTHYRDLKQHTHKRSASRAKIPTNTPLKAPKNFKQIRLFWSSFRACDPGRPTFIAFSGVPPRISYLFRSMPPSEPKFIVAARRMLTIKEGHPSTPIIVMCSTRRTVVDDSLRESRTYARNGAVNSPALGRHLGSIQRHNGSQTMKDFRTPRLRSGLHPPRRR